MEKKKKYLRKTLFFLMRTILRASSDNKLLMLSVWPSSWAGEEVVGVFWPEFALLSANLFNYNH